MKKLFIILMLLSTAVLAEDRPIKPNPTLTPGAVLTQDLKVLCVPGYTSTVRHVTNKIKRQVFKSYGLQNAKTNEYEVDHLVSLQLGGSNDIKNLWPQSYLTVPLNAKKKDGLENRLHSLMCKGKISAEEVQKLIATDWTVAYNKYMK